MELSFQDLAAAAAAVVVDQWSIKPCNTHTHTEREKESGAHMTFRKIGRWCVTYVYPTFLTDISLANVSFTNTAAKKTNRTQIERETESDGNAKILPSIQFVYTICNGNSCLTNTFTGNKIYKSIIDTIARPFHLHS